MSLAIAFDATRTYTRMPRTGSSVLTNTGLTPVTGVLRGPECVERIPGAHESPDSVRAGMRSVAGRPGYQSRSVTPHLSVSSRTTSCTVTSSIIPASATEATLSS
ncbi:hypothetical protein CCUG62472_02144 [Mycobacteroides salmoniphilum]|nr:hypothetical protein CCUG62472_02144 [Mycobacteroides salmoniphilum]